LKTVARRTVRREQINDSIMQYSIGKPETHCTREC
jgi:hypothetical protein